MVYVCHAARAGYRYVFPPGFPPQTSLCRALAQNLAIGMRSRFSKGHLVEINSHSLFSKWFSESGKLVMRLFDGIRAAAQKEDEVRLFCGCSYMPHLSSNNRRNSHFTGS